MNGKAAPTLDDLNPLPYHAAIVAYLKESEPEVWSWASSAEVERDFLNRMRTMLLKECYRLEAESHAELVSRCSRVAERLGVVAPITLYQASGDAQMNATLYYAPGEAHIVFSGAVLDRLKGFEFDAVLAHELAHYRLWEQQSHDYLVADRLLAAAADDPRASSSHCQTAQRLRLYTEIYADRGAFIGCGELHSAVAALVKMATGLAQVSAESYLRQADELFTLAARSARTTDHPETFVRARALRLWVGRDDSLDSWLVEEIEGETTVDSLCLLGQKRISHLTRRVISELLRPKWMQSPALLAHAHAFFPDLQVATAEDEALIADLQGSDAAAIEYWRYVLLDFARADRDLENLPLMRALVLSERFGWRDHFLSAVAKEFGLPKRQLAKLQKDAAAQLEKAESP